MQEDPHEFARVLTALAGLAMSEERIAAIAAVLPLLHGGAEALAAIEYGEIEPAPTLRLRPEAP